MQTYGGIFFRGPNSSRHHAAEAGILDRRAGAISGEHVVGAAFVGGFAMGHRADDGDLVRDVGGCFEMFAEDFAGDARLDRPERPAIFDRGVGLGIERFLRSDPAGQKNVDDRFCLAFFCRREIDFGQISGLCRRHPHVLPEAQPQPAHQSDIKEFSTRRRPPMAWAAAATHGILAHVLPPL